MKLILPSLVIGLIAGGAAGWLAADARVKGTSNETNILMSDDESIASIESRVRALEDRSGDASPRLDVPVRTDGSIDQGALLQAAVAKLEERMAGGAFDKQLNALTDKHLATRGLPADKSLTDWLNEHGGFPDSLPAKKKVTLAEAARELEMTQSEEDALREMTTELSDDMIKLLTTEDETAEDVKRELEGAKENPDKQIALMGKYMGRAMTNLPKFIEVMGSYQTRGTKILGAERWSKFEREYEVSDLDTYGFGEIFDN